MATQITETWTVDPPSRRHPGSVWIEQHQSDLPTEGWIAADGTGWFVTAATIDSLMSLVQSSHRDVSNVAVAFFTADSV